jgi:glycosyltransferase involved in cell wall biosynthesis
MACFGAGRQPDPPGISLWCAPHGIASTFAANLGVLSPSLPIQTRLYLDQHMKRLIRRLVDRFHPDVVHVTLARLGPYASALPHGVRVHVDFVDALSLNMHSRAVASRQPVRAALALEARLMSDYERRLAAAAHSCSVVSERDRRSSPGLRPCAVVPNGVDVDEFEFRDPTERPKRMLFFGNLGYFHNVGPARTVALEVLPRVRERVPGAVLRLAGARPASAVRALGGRPAVEVRAGVPRMASELHDSAVAVLPMASGSGMKNKVLEAFAAGTPVVANAAGVDGVEGAVDGIHYLAGETPTQLADACVALLEDGVRRRSLAHAARELVERRYSWDHRAETLLALYAGNPHT